MGGRIYGDESYLRPAPRRRSGFGISPYVGPLSALAFNRGSLLPLARGWQSDPATFVADRLRVTLRSEQVDVAHRARAGRRPPTQITLATTGSPPLEALVRHTNQVSDNYYAETLLKGLGARSGTTGSTAAGAAIACAVRARARAFAPASWTARACRGATRSPPARSAGCCTKRTGEPWFDSFYRSLPLAGQTGTLDKRMRGTARLGPLPRQDGHAVRSQRAGRLLRAQAGNASRSRC